MSLWLHDGALVIDGTGALVDCATCPCDRVECCCGSMPPDATITVVFDGTPYVLNPTLTPCQFLWGDVEGDYIYMSIYEWSGFCLMDMFARITGKDPPGGFAVYTLQEGDNCCNISGVSPQESDFSFAITFTVNC